MKTVLAVILAALVAAPIVGRAADKEAQNPKCYSQCKNHTTQAALTGHAVAQAQPQMESVSMAEVGQGIGVTFFTGNR